MTQSVCTDDGVHDAPPLAEDRRQSVVEHGLTETGLTETGLTERGLFETGPMETGPGRASSKDAAASDRLVSDQLASKPVLSMASLVPPARADLTDRIVVRTPVMDHLEPGRALCRKMHAQTIYRDIPFSNAKFDRAIARLRKSPRNSVALVAELNGQLIGASWATAGEYFIGEGAVFTTVHFIGVDTQRCGRLLSAKVFLRLLKSLRAWSDTRNARHMMVHVTTGRDLASTDRLLTRAGMQMIGGCYVG
ncbi:MAG: hypothetical protein OXR62_00515 [Ahrensia sp.]|nr:hypothetical protein [Ahrensia sp.]